MCTTVRDCTINITHTVERKRNSTYVGRLIGTRMRTRGKTMAEGIFSCKIREKAKEKEEKGRIKSGRKRV